jgi:chaperonin cofactor prefoldin
MFIFQKVTTSISTIVGVSLLFLGAQALAANGVPFKELQRQIDEANATIEALGDGMEERLASFELDVAMLQAEMDNLQSQIDSNDAELAELGNATSDNDSDIAALERQTRSLQSTLRSVRAELATKQDALTGRCGTDQYVVGFYPNGSMACGSPGHPDYLNISGPNFELPTWDIRVSAYVNCPDGWRVTGGGFSARGSDSGLADNYVFERSEPLGSSGWRVTARHGLLGAAVHIRAWAVCTAPG